MMSSSTDFNYCCICGKRVKSSLRVLMSHLFSFMSVSCVSQADDIRSILFSMLKP